MSEARKISNPCSVGDCERTARNRRTGWCKMHYERMRRYGRLHNTHIRHGVECNVEGCSKKPNARAMCAMHYRRWKLYGSPDMLVRTPHLPWPDRLITRFDGMDNPNGCWVWTGALMGVGYGMTTTAGGKRVLSHRAMYERMVGPIPAGLDLDHLCRNRACGNPAHLEPVTRQENLLRGAQSYNLTGRCMAGLHDMTDPTNIRVERGGNRRCEPCRVLGYQRRAAQRKAARQ